MRLKKTANGVKILPMTNDNKEIFHILEKMHPDAHCELEFSTPFELLVAVILSAQCTDKRVNIVTKELFKVANTPEQLAVIDREVLENLIHSCGFYHNKANSLIEMSKSVLALGGMPSTRDELMLLQGVGRKTANVVYSVAYGGNAIAVDTHVFRVSNRIGLVNSTTPEDTEEQLMKAFDEEMWSRLHHFLIFLGRYTCTAKNPKCDECELKNHCKYYKNCKNIEQ